MAGRFKKRAAAAAAAIAKTDQLDRRARKIARAARHDGFINIRSAIGTAADPSVWTVFQADPVTDLEARQLWEGNDIACKIIECLPSDAFRAGFEIKTGDKEQSEEITAALEDLGTCEMFRRAGMVERAYGGSAIYPVINDGADLSQPLRETGRIPTISDLIVLEPRELQPVSWYRDLTKSPRGKFGMPMRYRLNPITRGGSPQVGQLIHESRLIVFPGVVTSRDYAFGTLNGWGSSRLTRAKSAINGFGISWAGIETLMHRMEQGVYKMSKFAEMIADDDGSVESALLDINRIRSLIDMLVIDKDDDYIRLGVPLTGVSGVLELLMTRVSAAADMPATKLFGRAPQGMNATGRSDEEIWDDTVMNEQVNHYGPRLSRLVKLYMLSNDSVTGGKEPDMWSVEWHPLSQEKPGDKATKYKTMAEADDIQINNGVLTPDIVRRNRYGGDTYSMETQISPEDLDKLERLAEAPSPDQIAQIAGNPVGPPPTALVGPLSPSEPTPTGDRTDDVVERGGKWYVTTKDRSRDLGGPYDSKEQAVERLRQIEGHVNHPTGY